MLILGLLGMYFDAAVVFVKKTSLLFRLALAILRVKIRVDLVNLAALVQSRLFLIIPSCFL